MIGVCFKLLTIYYDDDDIGYLFPSVVWIIILPGVLGYLITEYIYIKNIFK